MISTAGTEPLSIDGVRRRIDRWRRTRRHARAPLPAPLWAAAVAVVRAHGVYGTARALGISYGALKRHVEREARERARPPARFVELPPAPVAVTHLIEIEPVAGPTVRVHLTGLPLSEVAAFTRWVAGAGS